MAIGFGTQDFTPIVGWTLYQVTLDKHHVMFWFNEGHDLLNVAYELCMTLTDGKHFTYDLYGPEKLAPFDSILRESIASYEVISKDELCLRFENGVALSILDNPSFRSWWFLPQERSAARFALGDLEYSDLTRSEAEERMR